MTSYTRTINEGSGGYVSGGYVASGYVVAQTTMADSIGKVYGAQRTASGLITIIGLIPNRFIGRGIAQTLNNANAVVRKLAATRELSTGAGGYTSSGYDSGGYLTADITQIVEVLAKVRNVPRTLTQTITNINAVGRIYGAVRTIIPPTLTISDTLGRLYGAVRTLTPTVTIVETTFNRALVATRTMIEASTILEILVAFKGIAGTGAARIRTATSYIFKRTGVTSIFKRSGETSF